MYVKSLKVEVYLVEVRLGWKSDPKETVSRKFSKADTIGECCLQKKLNQCLKKIGSNPSILNFVLYFVL